MPIILVVDDSETDRKLIGGLLKCKLDWIVQYASDGAEACELVGQIFPDVVITDPVSYTHLTLPTIYAV